MDIQVQEAQRTPFRHNKTRSSPHIIVKLANYKDKERILKAAQHKRALIYKGRHIRVAADLSTETWQARREWQEINTQCAEEEKYAAKNPSSSKAVFQNRRRDKGYSRQTKTKGVPDH